jgi:hypothetical protein
MCLEAIHTKAMNDGVGFNRKGLSDLACRQACHDQGGEFLIDCLPPFGLQCFELSLFESLRFALA